MRKPNDAREKGRTIQDYKSKRRRIEIIGWPGAEDRKVGLLYLHAGEQQAAWFATREHWEKRNQQFDEMAGEQIDFEWQYQLAYLMLIDPEYGNPNERVFRSVDEVRRELTPNEVSWFIDKHEELRKQEYAEWTGESADRHVRQIGDILGLGTDAKAADIVAKVAELKIGAGIG